MATKHIDQMHDLDCFMCFKLPEEPKLLACGHTFCQKCLEDLIKSQEEKTRLACPLCRETTTLEQSDVSKLQTNIPLKSMIADEKSGTQMCTVCNIEEKSKSPALCYCEKCSHYLCESCVNDHRKFKLTSSHVLVSIDDVITGKVKTKPNCAKHPQEEREWVCKSCAISVCLRCRVLDHGGSDHKIEDLTKYMKAMKDKITSLQNQATAFMESMTSDDIDLRDEELVIVKPTLDEIISEINEAWDAANQHFTMITKMRDDLIEKCNAYREEYRAEVRNVREKRDEKIACINSANDLIGKGVETVLEGQKLSVHDNLCRRLEDLLDSANTEYSKKGKTKEIARRVARLTFTPYRLDAEHLFGELSLNQWRLVKKNEIVLTGWNANSLATTHDGRMVVGYGWGEGVEVCSVNGSKERRLEGASVLCVCVLRNGSYVVRDWDGHISLYSQIWEKDNADVFEGVDVFGGMDVDGCGDVYVGCDDAETVHVYTPEGGTPIRKVPCPGYNPATVCSMNHSDMLVLSDGSSVRVVDREGNVINDVSNGGFYACTAVLRDDNILIGWGKAFRVSVDLYTNQLRHVKRVLAEYPVRSVVCAIRELSTGEIAVCGWSKLHIFSKTPVPPTRETS